jgi:hypothetical protein
MDAKHGRQPHSAAHVHHTRTYRLAAGNDGDEAVVNTHSGHDWQSIGLCEQLSVERLQDSNISRMGHHTERNHTNPAVSTCLYNRNLWEPHRNCLRAGHTSTQFKLFPPLPSPTSAVMDWTQVRLRRSHTLIRPSMDAVRSCGESGT